MRTGTGEQRRRRQWARTAVSAAAAAAWAAQAALPVRADQPIIYNAPTPGVNGAGVLKTYGGDIGYVFQVGDTDLVLNQFGFYDANGDGLATNHRVGVWMTTDTGLVGTGFAPLLGSTTVPSGTSVPIDGGFRYVDVSGTTSSITLLANHTYVVAAEMFNTAGSDQYVDAGLINWNQAGIAPSPLTRTTRYSPGGAWPLYAASQFGINISYSSGNIKVSQANHATFNAAGPSASWNSAANWGGTLPSFAAGDTSLTIAGTATSINNNVVGASIRGLTFAAGTPAATLTGNGFTLNGTIANYSTNTQTISTGQLALNQSYIEAVNGNVVVNADLNVGNGSSSLPLVLSGSKDITLNGNLSGNSSIEVDATGNVALNGSNGGFGGDVHVNGGVVAVSSPNSLGGGALTIGAGGRLKISGSNTYGQTLTLPSKPAVQSGAISQPPQLQSVGINTWSGEIDLTGGANNHVIDSASGTLTINGSINNQGTGSHTLYFQGSGDGVMAGGVGEGAAPMNIIKTGSGTWTFDTGPFAMFYTGGTRVLQGTLALDYRTNNNDQVNSSPMTLSGGTLMFIGNDSSPSVQAFGKTTVSSGGASTVVTDNGAAATMTAQFNDITRTAGGAVDFRGTGTATTNNANVNDILGGWATVNAGSTWARNDGSVNITGLTSYTNDTWAPGNNTDVTTSSSPAAGSTTYTLRFNAAAANTLTLSGTNTVSSGGILVTPNVGANTTTITGGALEPANAISATNTTRDLIIQQFNTAAPLVISSQIAPDPAARAGATTSGSAVVTGLTSTADLYAGMPISGAGIPAGATIKSVDSASQITLSANATAAGSPNLTITNNAFVTKAGPGTLVLNSPNTFAGSTYLSDGRIVLGDPDALRNSEVDVYRDNALDFNGLANATIGNLGGYANVDIGATNVTLSNNNNPTYDGSISGSGNITKAGTGTNVTWTNANPNYTGVLTVAAGRLNIKNPGAFGTTAGGTVVSTSGVNNTGGEIYILTSTTTDEPFTIAGLGFNGNEGALRAGSNSNVILNAPLLLGATGTTTRAGLYVDDLSKITLAGGVAVAPGANADQTLQVTGGAASSGLISGDINLGANGALIVNAGRWVVTSANVTYGNTTIASGGNLQIGDGGTTGALGTGPISVSYNNTANNTGNLVFDRSDTITVPNVISGSGIVTQSGGGTLALSGTNTFTGGLQIQNGVVEASADANLGGAGKNVVFTFSSGTLRTTGAVTPAAAGHPILVYAPVTGTVDTNGFDSTFGAVTGSGAAATFRKTGSGTLTVASANIATLSVDAGTLAAGSGALTVNSLSLAAGAVIDLTRNSLVINYGSAADPLPTMFGYLAGGYHAGAWDGPGITSSTARLDPHTASALGYFDDAANHRLTVKYTWFGDANFDDKLNADDYARLDRGFAKHLTGWINGDFNYDGVVDAADYFLIDRAFIFASGGGTLSPDLLAAREAQFGSAYVHDLIASVPEPVSGLWTLLCGGAGLASRRTRGRRQPCTN